MRKLHVGSCVGLCLAVVGCGAREGDTPGDVAAIKGELQAAPVDSYVSAGISADIAAELAGTPSLLEPVLNLSGVAATVHTSGFIDRTNPFFLSLATNGRTCET